MMAQEYKLLKGSSPAKLTAEVNEHLSRGWQLMGGTSVAVSNQGAVFVQAVFREYELPGAWG